MSDDTTAVAPARTHRPVLVLATFALLAGLLAAFGRHLGVNVGVDPTTGDWPHGTTAAVVGAILAGLAALGRHRRVLALLAIDVGCLFCVAGGLNYLRLVRRRWLDGGGLDATEWSWLILGGLSAVTALLLLGVRPQPTAAERSPVFRSPLLGLPLLALGLRPAGGGGIAPGRRLALTAGMVMLLAGIVVMNAPLARKGLAIVEAAIIEAPAARSSDASGGDAASGPDPARTPESSAAPAGPLGIRLDPPTLVVASLPGPGGPTSPARWSGRERLPRAERTRTALPPGLLDPDRLAKARAAARPVPADSPTGVRIRPRSGMLDRPAAPTSSATAAIAGAPDPAARHDAPAPTTPAGPATTTARGEADDAWSRLVAFLADEPPARSADPAVAPNPPWDGDVRTATAAPPPDPQAAPADATRRNPAPTKTTPAPDDGWDRLRAMLATDPIPAVRAAEIDPPRDGVNARSAGPTWIDALRSHPLDAPPSAARRVASAPHPPPVGDAGAIGAVTTPSAPGEDEPIGADVASAPSDPAAASAVASAGRDAAGMERGDGTIERPPSTSGGDPTRADDPAAPDAVTPHRRDDPVDPPLEPAPAHAAAGITGHAAPAADGLRVREPGPGRVIVDVPAARPVARIDAPAPRTADTVAAPPRSGSLPATRVEGPRPAPIRPLVVAERDGRTAAAPDGPSRSRALAPPRRTPPRVVIRPTPDVVIPPGMIRPLRPRHDRSPADPGATAPARDVRTAARVPVTDGRRPTLRERIVAELASRDEPIAPPAGPTESPPAAAAPSSGGSAAPPRRAAGGSIRIHRIEDRRPTRLHARTHGRLHLRRTDAAPAARSRRPASAPSPFVAVAPRGRAAHVAPTRPTLPAAAREAIAAARRDGVPVDLEALRASIDGARRTDLLDTAASEPATDDSTAGEVAAAAGARTDVAAAGDAGAGAATAAPAADRDAVPGFGPRGALAAPSADAGPAPGGLLDAASAGGELRTLAGTLLVLGGLVLIGRAIR